MRKPTNISAHCTRDTPNGSADCDPPDERPDGAGPKRLHQQASREAANICPPVRAEKREYMNNVEAVKAAIESLKGRFAVYTSASALYSVCIDAEYDFALGDSEKAVVRKIRRQARKLHLRADTTYLAIPTFYVVGRKDLNRLRALLEYCNGAAIERTARNNYGRHNGHRPA